MAIFGKNRNCYGKVKMLAIFILLEFFSNTRYPEVNGSELEKYAEETSSWSFANLAKSVVESLQSFAQFVIGIEKKREFYIIHIKDKSNPANNKMVLRERGRDGKDGNLYDISNLPEDAYINPELSQTEYLSEEQLKEILPEKQKSPDVAPVDTKEKEDIVIKTDDQNKEETLNGDTEKQPGTPKEDGLAEEQSTGSVVEREEKKSDTVAHPNPLLDEVTTNAVENKPDELIIDKTDKLLTNEANESEKSSHNSETESAPHASAAKSPPTHLVENSHQDSEVVDQIHSETPHYSSEKPEAHESNDDLKTQQVDKALEEKMLQEKALSQDSPLPALTNLQPGNESKQLNQPLKVDDINSKLVEGNAKETSIADSIDDNSTVENEKNLKKDSGTGLTTGEELHQSSIKPKNSNSIQESTPALGLIDKEKI